MSIIIVKEHASHKYSPRTYVNAKSADITLAFAVDFTTAGEKLTAKAAWDRYVAIDLKLSPIEQSRLVYRYVRQFNAKKINIAGNGIYTLGKHGWSQKSINAHLFEVIKLVNQHWPIECLISGGQTGVDIAGLVAGHALGIQVEGLLPNGYVQRGFNAFDKKHTEEEIIEQIKSGAEIIRQSIK